MTSRRAVVTLHGELNVYRLDEIRRQLAVEPLPTEIDIRDARIVDATVLGELARVAKAALPRRIVLRCTSKTLRRMFSTVRFDEFFEIVE